MWNAFVYLVTPVTQHPFFFFKNFKVRLEEADRFCHLQGLPSFQSWHFYLLGLCQFDFSGLTSKGMFLWQEACFLVLIPGTSTLYPVEACIVWALAPLYVQCLSSMRDVPAWMEPLHFPSFLSLSNKVNDNNTNR